MILTDNIGNPLKLGDLVMVQHGENLMLAIVDKIHEPSIVSPDPTKKQQFGYITLNIMPETMPLDPRQPIIRLPNVTRVVKPPQLDQDQAKKTQA